MQWGEVEIFLFPCHFVAEKLKKRDENIVGWVENYRKWTKDSERRIICRAYRAHRAYRGGVFGGEKAL